MAGSEIPGCRRPWEPGGSGGLAEVKCAPCWLEGCHQQGGLSRRQKVKV
ncbi:rCG45889 [Rattus norvegicus]|uniref:RCG45889 n=1 Tax=Rattus norvegicus TaxID=10116 RepID=A6JTZ4_RAT|nr:rCG45889 [Rattus norvegicus]